MFCRNCGKENKDEAKFCAFCGAPLEQPNKTHETEMPAAGPSGPESQNGDGGVPDPEGSMPEMEKPGKKRRRRIWIPILAVCVIAAAAAAAVIIGFFITKDTRQYNRY
ncbi:MAG TPA: zinc ribbon domain-containing protein, partial [Candidatus Mediterraneibacter stercoravium]|nr:zinc ribbon domain-containing protein [Candidatus Mediterraneibacter stercoravium]